jgi:hypothetical protein
MTGAATRQGEHALDFEVRRRPSVRRLTVRSEKPAFTAELILAAMKRWACEYGEPPTMVDWEPARARRLGQPWRAERFESGEWPSVRMVRRHFDTFNNAVHLAGLPVRSAPSRLRPNISDPDAVLEAMIEWTRRYGDVPTMADWDPVRARRLRQDWRIARYNLGDWPSARTVSNHFGSFAKAASAAGLVPRVRSSRRADRRGDRSINRERLAQRMTADRSPGIKDLASSLSSLAAARGAGDPVAMHVALLGVAASALAWAELPDLDTSPVEQRPVAVRSRRPIT